MDLGTALGTLRRRQALTQAGLSERAGVSARTIGEIECGVQRHPRAATLTSLLDALGVEHAERAPFFAAAGDAPDAVRPPLPTPAYDLIGRADDVAAIERALRRDDGRLVTLVGPAGVGKTALALAVARRYDADAGAAAFIDAASAHDVATVRERIFAALGLPLAPGAIVRSQPASLVVVDTFEHLGHAASDLAALIDEMPYARFLVTSRDHVRLRVETVLRVEPLALDDAVALFAYHARRLHLGVAFAPDDARVRAICSRVDRLPLAIELAVPRLRFDSLATLAAALADASDALASPHRDAGERHRSIRDAIDASYRLLSDDERAALRALATFRGGASAAGVAALLEIAPARAGELLAELGLKSLARVRTEGDRSRVALLETIRAYAAERARERGETARFAERHARHVHAARASRETRSDTDDVRAAVDWSIAHGEAEIGLDLIFDEHVGSGPEVGSRAGALDALLAALDPAHPRALELRVKGAWTRGWYAFLASDFGRALASFEEAVRINADPTRTWGLNLRDPHFLVLSALGEDDRALALGRAAIDERRRDAPEALACTLANVGVVALFADRLDEAGRYFREAAQLDERNGSGNLSSSLRNLAAWAVRSGDTEAASAYARLAAAAMPPDRPFSRMHLDVVSGEIALASGRPMRALDHLAAVLDYGGDFTNALARQDACFAMVRIGEAFAALARTGDARVAYRLTRDLYAYWSLRAYPCEERRLRTLARTVALPARASASPAPLRTALEADFARLRADVALALASAAPAARVLTAP